MKLDSFVSYFVGGALSAAIALVLIPRGIEHVSLFFVGIAFGTGGLVFWKFSAWAKRTRNPASQFMGMLLDFFPEAMLPGALAANGSNMVYLLACLIALKTCLKGLPSITKCRQA